MLETVLSKDTNIKIVFEMDSTLQNLLQTKHTRCKEHIRSIRSEISVHVLDNRHTFRTIESWNMTVG
jgi:hypothetical protein